MTVQFLSRPSVEDSDFNLVKVESLKQVNRESNNRLTVGFDELLNGIRCTMIAPKELASVPDNTLYRMIELGFRISLPQDVKVKWARYKVLISPTIPGNKQVQLHSFYPKRIKNKVSLMQSIFLHDVDIKPSISDSPKDGFDFDPYIHGFNINNEIIWDFLPFNSTLNMGTEHLLISIKSNEKFRLRLKLCLFISVFNENFGEFSLQMSPEVRDVF
jgi:hypothetical protein